jgi:hypothetical protein
LYLDFSSIHSSACIKNSFCYEDAETPEFSAKATEIEVEPPISYSYTQLLTRVVDLLHQNNPELTEKRRYTMKPPQLMKGEH